MLDYINPFGENFILKGVLEALQVINPLSDNFIFRDFFKNVIDILDYINPFSENFFGKKIIELLSDLLSNLFIPKEESFTKFETIFKEKLSFVDSIKLAINSIKNMFNDVNSLPKFTIDINSKYYEGELTVIDLSWYAQYKAYGDLVITGFCYVFFFWRLWCHLPSILHGLSSSSDFIEKNINIK